MTEEEKAICLEAVKLIDDLSDAFRIPLFSVDRVIRDELERIGNAD